MSIAGDHETSTEPIEQLIRRWNSTRAEYPADRCLHELVVEQARRTPDAVAVVDERTRLTYRQLVDRASRLANLLRGQGIGADSIVGVHGLRSADLVVALLGVQLAGAAYLPLDPDLPADRLRYMAEDAAVPLIVVTGMSTPDWIAVPTLDLAAADLDAHPPTPPRSTTTSANLAYVIYTSGSTGRPKGVCVPHQGVVNRLVWMQRTYRLGAHDRVLQKTPFGFDVSVWEFFWPIMVGATVVMARPDGHRDTGYLRRVMARERITTVHFVPSMLDPFLDEPEVSDLPALRRVICSGEALSAALVLRARQTLSAELHNLYGPTEASIDVTSHHCHAVPGATTVPIGAPIANTRIHILDVDGRPVEVGATGEIHLAGDGLARGYLSRPALTAERFVPDPFDGGRMYRTGDLGRWRPDGEVEYLGRIDNQVKIRGNRVELGEIEAALEAHPAVRAAVVVARENWLVAYLAAGPGAPDREAVAAWLAPTLPDYMIPRAVVRLDEFPLSTNGKVDRAALPEPAGERSAGSRRVPTSPAEVALASVWRRLLSTAEVGLDDDVFASGGDSITAQRISVGVRALGYRLSAGDILAARTLEHMAARMEPSAEPEAPRPATTGDSIALTAMQAGMLFHSESDVDGRDYFEQTVLTIVGSADAGALETAFRLVVARHEILRTVFDLTAPAGPTQRILPKSVVDVTTHDWRTADAAARFESFRQLLADDLAAGFPDLDRRPPIRLAVVRAANDRLDLVLSYHHALLDGWSLALLADELLTAYRATRSGEEPVLPQPVPFRRYADHLSSLDIAAATAHWRAYLDGCPGPATPRLAGGSGEGTEEVAAALGRERTAALHRVAAEHGATVSSVLHAAWALLLGCYSGHDDIVFGSTVSGRNTGLPDVDGIVGTCINTVPVRARLRPETTLADLVTGLQGDLLGRGDHELVPLATIQAQANLAKGTSLLDSIVVVENYPEIGGGELRMVETIERTGYPLVVVLAGDRGAPHLRLRHQTRHCSPAEARGLVADLLTVLDQFVSTPRRPIAELALTTPSRAGGVAIGAARPASDAESVHRLIEAQVARTPSAVAVRSACGSVTYAELDARANRIAWHLRGRGVKRGDLVGVALRRSPELIAALLGVWKAGAAYVPLAPDVPRARLAVIAEDAELACVLTEQSLVDGLAGLGPELVPLDRHDLDDLPATAPDVPVTGADLAYVIYTSGSTGRPKGVACHHGGLVNYLRHAAEAYRGPFGSGAPLLSSFGFDLVVPALYGPLLRGEPVCVLPEGIDAGGLAEALLAYAPYSFVKLTPGHLRLLVEQLGPREAAGLAGALVVGGESFPVELWRRWADLAPDTVVFNEYGPTEGTVANVLFRAADRDDHVDLPIGRPIRDTSTYVLDRWLNPVPAGVTGEIYLGGSCVARGYLSRPGHTADRFLPDPHLGLPGARMYRTGDLGRQDADGVLHFLGRADNQVKVRGYRVEPGEIEVALTHYPAVTSAHVAAVDGRLLAFVVLAAGAAASGGELRTWLSDGLPAYLVPSVITPVAEIPLNANGKVDLAALTAHLARDVAGPAPSGPVEEALGAVWQEVLGGGPIARDANFFELGGDSILTLKVVSGARRRGLAVTAAQIFRQPTVAGLAPLVSIMDSDRPEALPAVSADDIPLTPIQRWFLGLGLVDQHHYNQSVTLRFEDLDHDRFETALNQVVARHDALRLRFHRTDNGWRQRALSTVDPISLARAVEPADLQAGLDIEHGPMLAAGVVTGSPGVTVLLAVHHLAIDTLSWPILLDDLARAYRGEQLPPARSSFTRWAHLVPDRPGDATPVDAANGRQGDTVCQRTRLDPDLTAALLRETPAKRLRVEDLLVTATALATGQPEPVIDVERHGRDEARGAVDPATVAGWLTAVHPVRVPTDGDLLDTLLRVKQRLRGVHGPGEVAQAGRIVLNYHGRENTDRYADFVRRPGVGPEKATAQQRTHLLEIEASVRDGALELEWHHCPTALSTSDVKVMADRFRDALVDLVRLVRGGPVRLTPADFPLARVTQAEVTELSASLDIEDVYPLSDMQAAMVMHSLISADEGVYLEQQRFLLSEEDPDPTAFTEAWRDVVARHEALRSVVRWELSGGPAQVVLAHADLDVRVVPEVTEDLLRAERVAGFDFDAGPPLRLTLARRGPTELDVVFTFHHVVLDGWSVALLVDEVLDRYRARRGGDRTTPASAFDLRHAVTVIANRGDGGSREFWRRELRGFTEPTPLPVNGSGSSGCAVLDLPLGADLSAEVRAAAAAQGLTLSTLAHAAWAALLAGLTGARDVLFGSVVSGRAAHAPELDHVVGMVMNTLPFRVGVDPDADLGQWLGTLQQRHAALRTFEHSSLVDIAADAGVAGGLFGTIVTVENIRRGQRQVGGVRLRSLGSWDSTDHPLTLVIDDGDQLTLRLAYQHSCCDLAGAHRLLALVAALLRELRPGPGRTVGDALAAAGARPSQPVAGS